MLMISGGLSGLGCPDCGGTCQQARGIGDLLDGELPEVLNGDGLSTWALVGGSLALVMFMFSGSEKRQSLGLARAEYELKRRQINAKYRRKRKR